MRKREKRKMILFFKVALKPTVVNSGSVWEAKCLIFF